MSRRERVGVLVLVLMLVLPDEGGPGGALLAMLMRWADEETMERSAMICTLGTFDKNWRYLLVFRHSSDKQSLSPIRGLRKMLESADANIGYVPLHLLPTGTNSISL
jgi:hypothetical protein